MSGARRLIGTRRRVPPGGRGAYEALWTRVHAEATGRGAHAWRFASRGQEDLFLEFLEFTADADPRTAPGLAGALAELEGEFPGEAEEWDELR